MKLLALAMFALSLVGCGGSEKAEFDSLVDDVWLGEGTQLIDAVSYLEAGRRHHDYDGSGTTVDRDHALPLMKRLRDEFQLQPKAMISDDDTRDFATELLVALPAGGHESIKQVVDEADDKYPGNITQEWGHKWLAISFLE